MFYAPELLRIKRKGDLLHCWLAGTLSESMFFNKVSRMRISKINVVESGEEIMEIVIGRGSNGTPRFSLYLSSHLLYGLIKIFTFQSVQLEKSAMKCCAELSARLAASKKKNKQTTFQIDLDHNIRDDFPIPAPNLSSLLDRPTPRDVNRIYEISPESHKRMMEATDSKWNFRMSGEEIELPSIVDIRRADMADFSLGLRDDPIVEEVVFGTPQKRLLSPETNVDSPSKRQRVRKSLRDEVRSAPNGGNDRGEATVLPMELDDEPHPLPIDVTDDVVPVEVRAPLDNLPLVDGVEAHPLPIDGIDDVLPVDVRAPLDTVVPADAVVQEDPSHAVPIVQPTVLPKTKRRRRKRVDAKIVIPDNKQLGHRDNEAPLVSMLVAHPGRMIEPSMREQLFTVLNFDNQHFSRLCCNRKELLCIDTLFRYEEACDIPLDISDLQYPEMLEEYLPKDMLTTVDGKLVQTTEKSKTTTIEEPPEEIAGPLPEMLQPETMNDPTFDNISGVQFPFGNIENTELLENTSGPDTVSVGRVEMLTDPPVTANTIDHLPPPDPGVENLEDFLPPLPPKDQRASTKSRQSISRRSDALIDITSEPPSPSLEMAAETKKDLEACLEVYWHDRDIVTFEELAPPSDTTVVEANNCFILILELYNDDKIELSQNETNGPINIKKVVTSVPMDISL